MTRASLDTPLMRIAIGLASAMFGAILVFVILWMSFKNTDARLRDEAQADQTNAARSLPIVANWFFGPMRVLIGTGLGGALGGILGASVGPHLLDRLDQKDRGE